MGFGAIPDYQQPTRQMTQQVTEEVHRLRRMNGVLVEPEIEIPPVMPAIAESTFQLK